MRALVRLGSLYETVTPSDGIISPAQRLAALKSLEIARRKRIRMQRVLRATMQSRDDALRARDPRALARIQRAVQRAERD